MLTDERLAELERLAGEAPEPDRELYLSDSNDEKLLDIADEFYAAARTAVPELLAEVRRLKSECKTAISAFEDAQQAFEMCSQNYFQLKYQTEEVWTEVRRLRAIEQAARAYCAINGTDRYNRLVEALNTRPTGYGPVD